MATENHSPPRNAAGPTGGAAAGTIAALHHAVRDGGRALLAILVFALIVRGVHLAEFVATNPLASELYSDAKLYHDWAVAIADGDLVGRAEPFHHPPAYPYFVALVYAIVGPHPIAVWVIQSLTGIVTLLCIFALARRVAARGPALLVTACAALYHPMVLFETRLLAESLTTFTSAIALVHLSGAAGPLTRGRLFLGGLTLGLATALRPNLLLALGAVVAALPFAGVAGRRLGERLRDGAAILLGAALAIAPFTARNAIVAGEFVLLCDTGGINLFLAHHAAAGASFRVPDPEWGNVEEQPRIARQYATLLAARDDLSWSEVSSVLARRALEFVRANPAREFELVLARARACLDTFEYEVLYSPAAERSIQRSAAALPLSFAPFAAFVLAGIAALLRCKTSRRDAATLACVAFTLAQWLTVLLFFQYARFRVVSLVGIAPLAAAGFAAVAAQVRERRPRVELGLAVVSAVIASLPRTAEANEQVANQHITIGSAFRVRGDLAGARAAFERARALAPNALRLVVEEHQLAIAQGDLDAARTRLEEALAREPEQPVLLCELSRFFVAIRQPPDLAAARDAAERAVKANPAFVPAHEALGVALILQQDAPALLGAMQRATRLPGATARLFAMLGHALRSTDPEAARAALEHALVLDPACAEARAELTALRRS